MRTRNAVPNAIYTLVATVACAAIIWLAATQDTGSRRPRRIIDTTEMVYVPAGEFLMGSERSPDERPVRKVYLDAFYIDKYEVSCAQYKKFLDATDHQWIPTYPLEVGMYSPIATRKDYDWDGHDYPPGHENRPVVFVTWEDAMAYCMWAGKRLPTEAEWEKAARGADGRKYPWGNEWDPKKCNSYEGKAMATVDVDSHEAGRSPYGCYNMAGNVCEWCLDWFKYDYYREAPNRNPQGPDGGLYVLVRGGTWVDKDVRCSNRVRAVSTTKWMTFGFRCAKSAVEEDGEAELEAKPSAGRRPRVIEPFGKGLFARLCAQRMLEALGHTSGKWGE